MPGFVQLKLRVRGFVIIATREPKLGCGKRNLGEYVSDLRLARISGAQMLIASATRLSWIEI